MPKIPEYPPILQGTPEQQIKQLREYIVRQIEIQAREAAAAELANATKEGEKT